MNQVTLEHLTAVTDTLRKRIDSMGVKPKSRRAMEAEAHFIAGAATVINALFPSDDPENNLSPQVPPLWIIAPMCGRSVLEEAAAPTESQLLTHHNL